MAEITHVIQDKKTKNIIQQVSLDFYNKVNNKSFTIKDWILNHLDLDKEYIVTEQIYKKGFFNFNK